MLALVALMLLAPQASSSLVATGGGEDACGSPVLFALEATGGAVWTLRVTVIANARSDYDCGGLAAHADTFVGAWGFGGACFRSGIDTLCIEGDPPSAPGEARAWRVSFTQGAYAASGQMTAVALT